ncbi:MAG TPA: HAMP domain-containing sensor histidine kinase [Actinoplanes sp.]
MTLRARVLILVVLVAAVATTATAWLTYRLAADHIAATQAADDRVVAEVTRTLVDHAQRHGTWDGLPGVVDALADATDKRIDVTTEAGSVVAGTARSPGGAPVTRVDPRPRLRFNDEDAETATAVTYLEVEAFRSGTRLAACLTSAGIPVAVAPGRNGVPHVGESTSARPDAVDPDAVDPDAVAPDAVAPDAVARCRSAATSTGAERDSDFAAVNACAASTGTGSRASCLQAAFTDRIRAAGPAPVLVTIGPADGGANLPVGPVVGVVALVMVCAGVGSAVVSRRALRPVDALTRAARRLGSGLGWDEVPVRGDDQVAELTRTFNAMAASLKRGEERQRRMVADVAHELRTPLSTVRSYLEGLIDGILPAGPELFVSLHDEALLQQRIVDDLQDLAQAEAGALTYRKVRLNAGELLESCRTAVGAQADKAGVVVDVQVTDHVDVLADADRLRQVVGNLVGNALRYTPAGGTITLRCAASGAVAVIEVTDTGCGIAPDDLPHVFDRFWRADASRGRTSGGSGLGLAIALQIVTDHGGHLSVRSRPGYGTTFTVRLPAAGAATA